MANTVQVIVKVTDQATAPLQGITGALGNMASVAGGIIAADVLGKIGEGLMSIASTGFNFNRSIENATARLNAFTKDTALSTQILEQLRTEASKTPFTFEDVANAGTNLLPVANQLNMDLMDLVHTAEILAASNPAEGLEGAAFALKEAASGDFTSIIERFNLSRSAINALKEEGVPNMEIISRVMADMGLDMDLVSNLSTTFDGRMSTLQDTLTNLAGAFTQPIFSFFSEQLGIMQGNLDSVLPELEKSFAWAGQMVADTFQTMQESWDGEWVDSDIIHPLHRAAGLLTGDLKDGWDWLVNEALPGAQKGWEDLQTALQPTVEEFEDIRLAADEWNRVAEAATDVGGELAEIFDLLSELIFGAQSEATLFNKQLERGGELGTPLEQVLRGLADAFEWLAARLQDVYNGLLGLIDLAGKAQSAVATVTEGLGGGPTSGTDAWTPPTPNYGPDATPGVQEAPPPVTTGQGATVTGGSGGRGQTTLPTTMMQHSGAIIYMTVNVYTPMDVAEIAYQVAAEIQKRK